jgi:hypothetical protein
LKRVGRHTQSEGQLYVATPAVLSYLGLDPATIKQVLPSIAERGIDGTEGRTCFRRARAADVEFATILLFDSLDAVRRFAGDDYETAYVPHQARAVLSDFNSTSAHYEVLLAPSHAA